MINSFEEIKECFDNLAVRGNFSKIDQLLTINKDYPYSMLFNLLEASLPYKDKLKNRKELLDFTKNKLLKYNTKSEWLE